MEEKKENEPWPRRESNTQPSDLESDALPLRHGVNYDEPQFNQRPYTHSFDVN